MSGAVCIATLSPKVPGGHVPSVLPNHSNHKARRAGGEDAIIVGMGTKLKLAEVVLQEIGSTKERLCHAVSDADMWAVTQSLIEDVEALARIVLEQQRIIDNLADKDR